MVRIFMAPKNDERGAQFNFEEQRRMMVELDKFVTQCRGKNIEFILINLVIFIQ